MSDTPTPSEKPLSPADDTPPPPSEKASPPPSEKASPPDETPLALLGDSLAPPGERIVPPAVKSKIERRVFWACIWSLLALGLIAWSLLSRKPIPVIVAMSVGQAIGTLSLLLFLGSIALDIRSRYMLARRTKAAPPPRPKAAPTKR